MLTSDNPEERGTATPVSKMTTKCTELNQIGSTNTFTSQSSCQDNLRLDGLAIEHGSSMRVKFVQSCGVNKSLEVYFGLEQKFHDQNSKKSI